MLSLTQQDPQRVADFIAAQHAGVCPHRTYEPAIRCRPGEAPAASRAARIYSSKLGRHIHAMSTPERIAICLALYHPGLFDLQEQRILAPHSTRHPLHDYPSIFSMRLLPLPGTVDTAFELELERYLEAKWCPGPDESGTPWWRGPVWIGDLLLFLVGDHGPYCVNWNVKAKVGEHDQPSSVRRFAKPARARERAKARLRIEERYYERAGIRTERFAGDEVDRDVAHNLRQLIAWGLRLPAIPSSAIEDLEGDLNLARQSGSPAIEVLNRAVRERGLHIEECRRVFYQAIFGRRLRVNLFRPVLIDRPMYPEERDVLVVYGAWFKE